MDHLNTSAILISLLLMGAASSQENPATKATDRSYYPLAEDAAR